MSHDYVHTLENEEKVEFYFNKTRQILDSQPFGYDKFPGDYYLDDVEPVLLECESYNEVDSTDIVNNILTYAISEMVQALIFETQEKDLALLVINDNKIIAEKFYQRLLRTKIISRLKLLTRVDPAEKKQPQVGILNISYREKYYLTKILFFPQVLGESIVILPDS